MTCPACESPIEVPARAPTLICACVWCAAPLVITGGDALLLTEEQLASLAPGVAGRLHAVRNAARMFGAARRN